MWRRKVILRKNQDLHIKKNLVTFFLNTSLNLSGLSIVITISNVEGGGVAYNFKIFVEIILINIA